MKRPCLEKANTSGCLTHVYHAVPTPQAASLSDPSKDGEIDLTYWAALSFVILFGLAMNLPSLEALRVKINEALVERLGFFGGCRLPP
jgi:hypothetical protein